MNDDHQLALFCDFENIAIGGRESGYEDFDIGPVLARLLLKGSIVTKKACCDWDRYKQYKNGMHDAAFELIEIPHVKMSGKNSADIRMVVDALDDTGVMTTGALSPLMVPDSTTNGVLVEDTEALWGDAQWGAGYLFSNGFIWAKGYGWTDEVVSAKGYGWTDEAIGAKSLVEDNGTGLLLNDDPLPQ